MKKSLIHSPPTLRAAVVGAGLMGRWHADAIPRVGGVVSVIVDPDRQRAAQLARHHPEAQIASGLEAVVAERLADVVHVCTPLETHEALAAPALGAGLHVLVEKPLAENVETTSKLVRLAHAQGVLLCPVHQFLFQPGVLRTQSALPKIRPLLHVDAVTCSAGAEMDGLDRDRVVAEILPHPLSLIARLVDARVSRIVWQVQHAARGELRATGQLGDVSVSMLISMAGRPTANALRLIGERGTAHVDLFHGFAVVERGAVSRLQKIAHPFALAGGTLFSAGTNLASRAMRRESAYPGLRELIRGFYEAVQTGGGSPVGASEILEVARARDALIGKMGLGA
jgi:predicted dehydrogenase